MATFLAKLAGDLANGRGVQVGVSDLGTLSAGKRLGKADCMPVLRLALLRFEAQNPGFLDLLFSGVSDSLREKVRRAAGAPPTRDVPPG